MCEEMQMNTSKHLKFIGFISVVSLDGTVASIAVTEFLTFVTGFRPTQTYTFYDMLEQRLVPRLVKPDPKCVACALKGLGDKAKVDRYAHTQIPKDIPQIKVME